MTHSAAWCGQSVTVSFAWNSQEIHLDVYSLYSFLRISLFYYNVMFSFPSPSLPWAAFKSKLRKYLLDSKYTVDESPEPPSTQHVMTGSLRPRRGIYCIHWNHSYHTLKHTHWDPHKLQRWHYNTCDILTPCTHIHTACNVILHSFLLWKWSSPPINPYLQRSTVDLMIFGRGAVWETLSSQHLPSLPAPHAIKVQRRGL